MGVAFLFAQAQPVSASIWEKIFGDNDADALKFLQANAPYLKYVGILGYFANVIGWGIIKFLYSLAEMASGLVDSIFKIGNLMKNDGVSSMYNSFIADVTWGVMLVCLIWFAIRWATSGSHSGLSIGSTAQQLIVAVMLLTFGSTIVNQLYTTAHGAFNDVTKSGTDIAASAITDNMDDILYLAGTNKYKDLFPGNSSDASGKDATFGDNAWSAGKAKSKTLMNTDFSAVLNKDDIDNAVDGANSSQKKALGYLKYHVDTDGDGNLQAAEIKDDDGIPFINVYKPGYQRYPGNKFVMMLSLISIAIAYVIVAFTIAITLIELPFKVLAGSLAVATLSQQKIKLVVNDVFQSFLLIFWSGVELRFYQIIMSAITQIKGFGALPTAIAFMAATFLLWKGQDVLTKYFGINTGLRGGLAPLMGAAGMAAMLGRGATAAKNGLNSIRGQGGSNDSNAAGVAANDDGSKPDASGNSSGLGSSLLGAARHPVQTAQDIGHVAQSGIKGVAAAASYAKTAGASGLTEDAVDGVKTGATAVAGGVKKAGAAVASAAAAPVVGAYTAAEEGVNAGRAAATARHGDTGTEPGTSDSATAQTATQKGSDVNLQRESGNVNETGTSGTMSPNHVPEAANVDSVDQNAVTAQAQRKAGDLDINQTAGEEKITGSTTPAGMPISSNATVPGTNPTEQLTTPGKDTDVAQETGNVHVSGVQGQPLQADGMQGSTSAETGSTERVTAPGKDIDVSQSAGNVNVSGAQSQTVQADSLVTPNVAASSAGRVTAPGKDIEVSQGAGNVHVTESQGQTVQAASQVSPNVATGSAERVTTPGKDMEVSQGAGNVHVTGTQGQTVQNGQVTPATNITNNGATSHQTVGGGKVIIDHEQGTVIDSGSASRSVQTGNGGLTSVNNDESVSYHNVQDADTVVNHRAGTVRNKELNTRELLKKSLADLNKGGNSDGRR